MTVPIVAIVGVSGSGKTTLIESLVPEFRRRGYKTGTLKHDARDFEIDYPGKDSFRHFHAGASASGIASQSKAAVVKRLSRFRAPGSIVDEFFGDVDIVLAEGFKRSSLPKIEVSRSATGRRLVCASKADRPAAVVADYKPPLRAGTRLFSPRDVKKIADFLEVNFMKKRQEASPPVRGDSGGFSARSLGVRAQSSIAPICERGELNDAPRVSLVVDGKNIPLNAFVKSVIANTAEGMTRALRGVKNPRAIRITVCK